MIRKYQNEWILLLALLVLLGGFLYQRGMRHKLEASLLRSQNAARQITEAKVWQEVWSTKGLKTKVASLKETVPSGKVKTFEQVKKKLTADFAGLSGQELNELATRIATIPVRIQEFAVTRAGTKYDVRCTCTW